CDLHCPRGQNAIGFARRRCYRGGHRLGRCGRGIGRRTNMHIRSYISLMKLRIGFLIAVSAMAGYAAVSHQADAWQLAVLFLAMLLGSSGSAVFNQFYDRDIDRLMPRTASRPLAAGTLQDPTHALWFAGALLMAGCVIALMAFNWVVALHLFLGAFVY